jgi:hypothetical protein
MRTFRTNVLKGWHTGKWWDVKEVGPSEGKLGPWVIPYQGILGPQILFFLFL